MKTLRSISLLFVLALSFPFCFLKSAEAPSVSAVFERIGPYGGDVRSLLIDSHNPRIVYLGTSDGQIYKSTDRGNTWALLLPGLARRQFVVDTLIQHPTDANHLFAGAWHLRSDGGGLFETKDGGRTWASVSLPKPSLAVRDFAICRDRPARMIVATLAGVFVTADGAKTWREVGSKSLGFHGGASVAIDPHNPKILYVGTWRLGYRSLDFGETWTRVDKGMIFDSHVMSLSVDKKNPSVVYASACTGIYRSVNRATTWKRLKIFPKSYLVRARMVYVDPVNSRRIYGGTTEGLFVSHNAGLSWKRLTSKSLTINSIQVDPENNKRILIATDDQGILRSEDGGANWQASNTGFIHRQISRIITDRPGSLFAGVLSDGHGGGFYRYEGKQWAPLTAEIVAKVPEVLSFLPLPGDAGTLAGTGRGVYWQQSPASSWLKLAGPIESRVVNDLALDLHYRSIYAATDTGIFRAGLTELQFKNPSFSSFATAVRTVVVTTGSPSTVYAGTNYGVLRSRDNGANWENLSSGLPDRPVVESVAVSPATRDHLFAGTSVGLFESRDGGSSWRKARDGRLGVDIPSVIFPGSTGKRILAADNTFGGAFLSEDGGETWDKLEARNFGSPVRYVAQDPGLPQIFYLGTNSDGLYRVQLQTKQRLPDTK